MYQAPLLEARRDGEVLRLQVTFPVGYRGHRWRKKGREGNREERCRDRKEKRMEVGKREEIKQRQRNERRGGLTKRQRIEGKYKM